MAKSRAQKEQIVAELSELLSEGKSFVLSDYAGMSVRDVQDLRGKMKAQDGEFMVVKNKLFRLALEKAGLPIESFEFTGPIALTISRADEVSSAKETFEFAKGCEALEIKAGLLEGKMISKEEVESLAKLPSKEQLLGQLVGTLNAPIAGFVRVLAGPSQGLVTALKAVADQKEA